MADDLIDGGPKSLVIQIPTEEQIKQMQMIVTGTMLVGLGSKVPKELSEEFEALNTHLVNNEMVMDFQPSDVSEVSPQDVPNIDSGTKKAPSI